MTRRRRLRTTGISVIGVLLGWLVTMQIAVAQSEKSTPKTQKPETFQVKVSKGFVSLDAKEGSLAKIFEEIGKQAGIVVESSIGPEEKVTIQFDRVPLEEAIKRLAKNSTIFYAEDPKEGTRRISRIIVLPEERKQTPAIERAKAPAQQPAKATEPASRPESFKFEFDPSKFMEKKGG